MALIEWFVRNPVKVSVGVLLVGLFGIIALFMMPMQLTPEVQIPTVSIETRWPGASPQEIEREIIQEQEEQLKSVEGVTKMTSEAEDSVGEITLEFAVGTEMSEAVLKVNTRLQQVREYPEDADEPVIRTTSLANRSICWFALTPKIPTAQEIADFTGQHPELTEVLEPVNNAPSGGLAVYRLRKLVKVHPEIRELVPPEVDVTRMRKFAEDVIEAEFERVDGVADARIYGGREEEMQVVIDPNRLAARRLTIADVRNALRGQNKDTSGGDFSEGKRRWVVRTIGQYKTPDQVANTIIVYDDGAPVYIRDVAEVRRGHKKPSGIVRRFGTQRLSFSIRRDSSANVLDVVAGLKKAQKRLNNGILKQRRLQLVQTYDETEYIHSSIGLVETNILVGGTLTLAILLLFLRSGSSTLVIGLAIPTSIVGTFLMLGMLGRSLNVISLAGMAFAVGMLVDNSVVVLENIYRHYQKGVSPLQAAVHGTKEVWGAVLASTLTTLAVFVPVLFVQEQAGQLFRDIALAISCGIGLSLIVSISVIPTAAARLLRSPADAPREMPSSNGNGNGKHAGWFHQLMSHPKVTRTGKYLQTGVLARLDGFGRWFVESVVSINARLQTSIRLRIAVVVGFVLGSIGLSYLMMPKVDYLPAGNRNLVYGIMLPPPGYNVDQMVEIGARMEKDLEPYWDPKPGQSGDLPIIKDYWYVARGRQVFLGVQAVDPDRTRELIPVIQKIGEKTPGTFVIVKQSSLFERRAGRTVDIEIMGPDLAKLVTMGGRIMTQVNEIVPGARSMPIPSLDLSSPELHVLPKREQAAQMAMSADEIGYAVDALVDGAYATDYFIGGDKIDLRIVGQEKLANQTQDIEALPIATPGGELVSLKALADVEIRSGPQQVNHRERQRAITIQVTPPKEMALEEAIDRIDRQILDPLRASGDLEGGLYHINLAGTADKLQSTWKALRLNFVLALLIAYLLMAALFESWLYPLVIIVSVPLGALGGFAGLWLLNLFGHQPLDVLTMLGFVILIGTVVNNPILIVEQSLVHMRQGLPMRQAVLESVRNRVRPIFMTTLTTLFGLTPLVLVPGSGSELYRGLGSVVLGGLLASTVITLVVVPSLFTLAMEAKDRLAVRLRYVEPNAENQVPGPPAEVVPVS